MSDYQRQVDNANNMYGVDWPARCRDLEIRLHNMEAAAKRYKLQLETLRAAVREAADKST